MTLTLTHQINPPLLVHFVLESSLSYPNDHDIDGRLACWHRSEGRWAIAWHERSPAGVACVVTLDDGPAPGQHCLYWLEVLPAFQAQGIGQTLLQWALTQAATTPLVIAATPESAPFYRHCLSDLKETDPNLFVLRGGDRYQNKKHVASYDEPRPFPQRLPLPVSMPR